ncbi:MAG: iron transporter substrate-binding protein [Polyangiaceae bacterium]|jgi:ABC-type Fe3+ transport system substrate-binding protein|nr:iron transporter substrate-binding protein [Polyangiaceae bacterium]
MKAALPGLVALAALLIVPFALRPKLTAEPETSRRLVLLTPHNEAIRYEMTRGFRQFLERSGQKPVRLDWRNPGGTTEIARYLSSEYRSAFEQYYAAQTGSSLSERGALAFANPKQGTEGTDEAARARRMFLESDVSINIDVLFGGGSYDFSQHAAAGRLVNAGVAERHPHLFGEGAIPQTVGGEPYWDKQGRWVGTCVSGFGICYNPEALRQAGIDRPPSRWRDLADPRLAGKVALADPSKSGSANKAFEMIVQQAMSDAMAAASSPAKGTPQEALALARGFDDGMRLIRQIGGVSRYFSDQATKVVQDVQSGSAAIGMCIDFYGRFESEGPGAAQRLRFVLPDSGSSMGADPIGLLRGAPAPALAKTFIDFVLSPEGQAMWAYKRGVPGGPERYALRRTPILPVMFEPARRSLLSDPDENPYVAARTFTYQAAWTGPLFRAISFVIRLMCVDTESELHDASAALRESGNPPRAKALFEDMSLVSYAVVKDEIAPALASGDPLREVALQNRLVTALKAHYERVTDLARSGQ